jgi:glycosyltransferase involved in cell wall biosynthesis
MKKITLVSHSDTLTGAPRLLMDIADLLFDNGYDITFVVKHATNSGLLNLRKNRFKVLLLKKYRRTLSGRLLNIVYQKYALQQFRQLLKQSDIVINNTIDNSDLLGYYTRYAKGKIISYLHELDAVIETHLPSKELKEKLVAATTHFIVPATYIKHRVAQKLVISEEKISVINSKIATTLSKKNPLNIEKPVGEFWVGMCGTADMRKGADIFVEIANYLNNHHNAFNIKLVWLGFEGESKHLIEEDIRKLNLQDRIILYPRTLYPDSFFDAIDVFALTSREDPYPLVVLSAASAAKPILCFAQSGGAVDFIDTDCGFVVPYLEVEAYCEKILHLYNTPNVTKELGQNAQKKAKAWHQTDALIVQQMEAVFSKIM